jgi:hypothetical protein
MPKTRKPISKPTPTPNPSEVKKQGAARDLQPTEAEKSPSQPKPESQIPRFIASKDFISVYANHAFFVGTTRWDMRIAFGEVQGTDEKGQMVVENRVSVTMPVECAKILLLGIQANLKEYERSTGNILNLPNIEMRPVKLVFEATGVSKPETQEPEEKK